MTRRTTARVAAVLFVVTAGLFVVGVSTEPDVHDESSEVTDSHDEATDAEAEGEAHDEGAGDAGAATHDEAEGETTLGIDVESPVSITAAVVVSLLLAGLLWARPTRAVGLAGVVVALGFAVLDIAEVAHQLDESRTGYALLAGAVAIGHAVAALLAGRVARSEV
jgi:hypothetical protein